MSKPRELPNGSEKTIVFNFLNFFNFPFLRKLSYIYNNACARDTEVFSVCNLLSQREGRVGVKSGKSYQLTGNKLTFWATPGHFKPKTPANACVARVPKFLLQYREYNTLCVL